jgi:hypothetical protein
MELIDLLFFPMFLPLTNDTAANRQSAYGCEHPSHQSARRRMGSGCERFALKEEDLGDFGR